MDSAEKLRYYESGDMMALTERHNKEKQVRVYRSWLGGVHGADAKGFRFALLRSCCWS